MLCGNKIKSYLKLEKKFKHLNKLCFEFIKKYKNIYQGVLNQIDFSNWKKEKKIKF